MRVSFCLVERIVAAWFLFGTERYALGGASRVEDTIVKGGRNGGRTLTIWRVVNAERLRTSGIADVDSLDGVAVDIDSQDARELGTGQGVGTLGDCCGDCTATAATD